MYSILTRLKTKNCMVIEINAEKLSNKIQFIHGKIKMLRKLIIEENSTKNI